MADPKTQTTEVNQPPVTEAPVVPGETLNAPDSEPVGSVDPTPEPQPTPEAPVDEQPAEEPVQNDPSFNCPDCSGTGLKDSHNLCATCKGTGKV